MIQGVLALCAHLFPNLIGGPLIAWNRLFVAGEGYHLMLKNSASRACGTALLPCCCTPGLYDSTCAAISVATAAVLLPLLLLPTFLHRFHCCRAASKTYLGFGLASDGSMRKTDQPSSQVRQLQATSAQSRLEYAVLALNRMNPMVSRFYTWLASTLPDKAVKQL